MRQKSSSKPGSAEQSVRDIRRATRRRYSAEEKIRIVLEGLRGEESIAELMMENRLLKKMRAMRWGGRYMRYAAAEKLEIIRLVERSSLPIRRTLAQLGIPKSTFYAWYRNYLEGGPEALEDRTTAPRQVWNKVPDEIAGAVVELALEQPERLPRELATAFTDHRGYFVSESTVYRLLKARDLITSPAFILMQAADRFSQPTTAINQLWQTDFTYLKVIGWGWFYLSTVLDDYSHYILAWKLCTTMTASDVADTLELALEAAGLDQAPAHQRPRLLSDNGPCYIATELSDWLDAQGMGHTRGAPYHPMTQGKIERYHRSMKNQVLLENYYLPGELKTRIGTFVDYYNHERYHESLDNLTPADVYFGRGQGILERRDRIAQSYFFPIDEFRIGGYRGAPMVGLLLHDVIV